MKTRILYIEDEELLGRIVKETLEKLGYSVAWETNGAKVIERLIDFEPDICVLDIMLPGVDGYTLSRQIRESKPDLPVIFLTAKTEVEDLVKGFRSGGTDYMRKPFSIEELAARIENQLRITSGRPGNGAEEDEIQVGKYLLYPSRYELVSSRGTLKLSSREMEVLGILLSNRNRITPRKQLLLSVWGDDSYFNSRTLDVYIRKLRRYLGEDPSIEIITLKGNGYLFLVR